MKTKAASIKLLAGIASILIPISAAQAFGEAGSVVGWGGGVVPGNDFVAVAVDGDIGGDHWLALRSDGSLVGWGWNRYGEADVPAGNDFVAIAVGRHYCLALRSDGSLVAWGRNDYGEADVPPGSDFVAIAAGAHHCLALRSDGSLVAWGLNVSGITDVPPGTDFVAIAAGDRHSLALRFDGSLVGWGYNNYGQTDVPQGNDFVAIAAGGYHSLAIRSDGSLEAWGCNNDGQTDMPPGSDFVAIAAGCSHSLAVRSDGSLIGWGWNWAGLTDVPAGNDFVAIAACWNYSLAVRSDGSLVGWGFCGQSDAPAGSDFVAIAAGEIHNLALRSDGSLVGWGRNSHGQTDVAEEKNFVAIAAGGYHSLAVRSDGSLAGWGSNSHGQRHVPKEKDFVAIAAGRLHSLALRSDGSLIGWGDNYDGQTDVPEENDFVAIAAGFRHSVALRSDGSLVGWGDNEYGQTDVPSDSDFVAIAAGGYDSLALRSDGSLVAWGRNQYGQTEVPSDSDFVAIAATYYHNLALRSDGSLAAWGSNEYGQTTVPAGNDFVAIAAGGIHSLALKRQAPPENQAPVAFFTFSPEMPKSGELVTFDASTSIDPDGAIISYEWDFGYGKSARGSKVQHRFRGGPEGNKEYAVKLTVRDDQGATTTKSAKIRVSQLTKSLALSQVCDMSGATANAKMTVWYNWIHDNDYVVTKVHYEAGGFIGTGTVSIWDSESCTLFVPIWVYSIHSFLGTPYDRDFSAEDWWPIAEQQEYDGETFNGIFVDATDVINLSFFGWCSAGAHILNPQFPVIPPVGKTKSDCFQPDLVEDPGLKVDSPYLFGVRLASPGEIRVIDNEGRITGVVEGILREEIPGSTYDAASESILISALHRSFVFQVAGIREGEYGITICLAQEAENSISFKAPLIPVHAGSLHEYTIDWETLGAGGDGVTVSVDADGDGDYETTIISDSVLTADELNVSRLLNIDIYPNRTPNRVYLSRNYTLYVAILGDADFDVSTVDAATVKFGRTGTQASPVRAPMMRDLNRDGFVDAMYGFQTFDCEFQLDDTEGVLTGKTTDGVDVVGRDSVLVMP